MPENLFCKTQKANSKEFRDHYDVTFRSSQDILFPEEIRERETERILKNASNNKKD